MINTTTKEIMKVKMRKKDTEKKLKSSIIIYILLNNFHMRD